MHTEWATFADKVFGAETWKLAVLALLFIVPVLKIAFLPFNFKHRFAARINKIFGIWEHSASAFRDFAVEPFLVAGAVWQIWRGIESGDAENFIVSAAAAALVAIGQTARALKRRERVRLLEFVKGFPFICPQEFFDYLLCASGITRSVLPEKPRSLIDPSDIDFTNGKKAGSVGLSGVILGAWSTVWITKLVILAGRERGDNFMHETANAFSIIWGARLAQIARARITVEDGELLPPPCGPQIFLYTHASFLDFAFAPFVLAARPGPRANFLPKFLVAKDHFIDNPVFHGVLGIGRACQSLGMIFVDRKAPDRQAEARRIACESASALMRGDGDLAIFPQGKRAARFKDARGNRLDAGYYTVGKPDRIRTDGGHLKKGAAHIAVTLSARMAKEDLDRQITVIPVAITGAATACPRGSLRIQTNARIKLRVGEPIVIVPSSAFAQNEEKYTASVKLLHDRIDMALKNTLHIHAELERRFFEDMRGMLDPMKIDEVAIAMKPWRGDDCLLHAILDAIYSCEPKLRRGFLGELTHLILNFAPREDFLALKSRIADEV